MLKKFFTNRSYIVIIHDILICTISYQLSFYLKFGIEKNICFPELRSNIFFENLILFLISLIGTFIFRTYTSIWKYISIKDLINIVKFASFNIVIFLLTMFIVNRLEHIPRSFFIINWLLMIAMLGFPRLFKRIIREKSFQSKFKLEEIKPISILLFGINNNTELFLREIHRDQDQIYKVVGIIDYDDSRIGSYLHNIRIYGSYENLYKIYEILKEKLLTPQKIIVTDDHTKGNLIRNLFKIADNLGMNIAKLPRLTDFKTDIDNKIEIRPIVIEDLLGRAQNSLDKERLFKLINNKKILITGCGGTIGSELTRQIASYGPSIIILIEHSEFNLYLINQEIKNLYPNVNIKSIMADIRNSDYIDRIFREQKPQIIFHAAALKHVPIVEDNIIEAVLTNIVGTKIIADKAVKYEADQMIFISTDKAVNPTSIMGATKRIAEKYINSIDSITKFAIVRFGNVLGSSGSVIPLFESQLKMGGPITITHPEMVRYFMTVREAVELVLQSSAIVEKSENSNFIFVLDMGEPVKIKDLANQMIKMSGLRPNIDINIVYTGIRPGEKLYEEIFYDFEERQFTEFKSIILVKDIYVDKSNIKEDIDIMIELLSEHGEKEILNIIKTLLPEYKQ